MKLLFLFISILCAATITALITIIVTGQVPFSEQVERVVIMSVPPKASSTVFSSHKEIVDVLIAELQAKQESYEKRIADLEAREEALKIMNNLKAEMAALQEGFEAVSIEVKASEQANFRRLASIFGAMASEDASALLQKMQVERAAVILNMLGERQAGAIMNAAVQTETGAQAAADWSDTIRRLQAEKKGG